MKLRSTQQRNRRAAFTLMEMMVVVAIIVALAGVGIFYMAGQVDEGNKTKAKADIKSLTDAALTYKTQHAGQWPQDLGTLMQRDNEGHGPYIRSQEDLISPWGTNFPYQFDTSGQHNNGLQPDIWVDSPIGKISNWTRQITR